MDDGEKILIGYCSQSDAEKMKQRHDRSIVDFSCPMIVNRPIDDYTVPVYLPKGS